MRKTLVLLVLGAMALSAHAQQTPVVKFIHPTGQVTLNRAKKPLKRRKFIARKQALPPAADLAPFAPPAVTQPYKDCYAYASVYAGRTTLYNATQQAGGTTQANIFSTGFLQALIYPNSRTCRKNGYDTYLACGLMQTSGVVLKSDYPDDCGTTPLTQELKDKALNYRVNAVEIYQYTDADDVKIAAIKSSLAAKRPVVIGWLVVKSFDNGDGGDTWTPQDNERPGPQNWKANHAICIIGYDDTRGAFQVQNSWGQDWGDKGRIWVKYADMASFSAFGIELSNP
jgi:C1A family cysteine protease